MEDIGYYELHSHISLVKWLLCLFIFQTLFQLQGI